ncbi:MAG: hypothetical protein NTX65_08245 [Ignavibacteriales bacterium]|nr:hypothetical protein [Ignavibacteriales bacterium]
MKQQEFEPVFYKLREILHKHSNVLNVSADRPNYYCLDIEFSPKLGKRLPVGWVKIGKNYVSYHFMPVYMFPNLREGISKNLRARMQGKSCFNFKKIDEPLFEELDKLTTKGLSISREAGFAPEPK